jgi:hypothetical protein
MAVEPWLRGTLGEVEPVRRAVLHALELAVEDAQRWCVGLGDEEMFARPMGLPSVGFQMRHMVRSLDRLLTYAGAGDVESGERRALSEEQLAALGTEMAEGTAEEVWAEFRAGMARAMERVRAVDPATFVEARGVGRQGLPTTVVGLLIHCAEHTQRHAGQMVTTAKVVAAG